MSYELEQARAADRERQFEIRDDTSEVSAIDPASKINTLLDSLSVATAARVDAEEQCNALRAANSSLSGALYRLSIRLRKAELSLSAFRRTLQWRLFAPERYLRFRAPVVAASIRSIFGLLVRLPNSARIREQTRYWKAFNLIRRSGLFRTDFYLSENPDVEYSGLDPLTHYIQLGSREGRRPNPGFDPAWYSEHYADVAHSKLEALAHYIQFGAKEGRRPSPLFDPAWYRSKHKGVNGTAIGPLTHYVENGYGTGLQSHPLFDVQWYRARYHAENPDALNPLEHYRTFGFRQGCRPHPLFDPDWYLRQYPDVRESGDEPLTHYLSYGSAAGRFPNPLFDPAWYRSTYPEVRESGIEPLQHYFEVGSAKGYRPNPLFDPAWYRTAHLDITGTDAEPLVHYLLHGSDEGRQPAPDFEPSWYKAEYPEIRLAGWEPFAHYLHFGLAEKRHTMEGWQRLQDRLRVEALGLLKPLVHERLSVGIVTYNNSKRDLERVVESVELSFRSTGLPQQNLAILLIDNGDPSHLSARPTLKTLASKGNIGFGAAHNLLMNVAFAENFDYYLALNPDGALAPDALEAMIRMNQASPVPALVEGLQFPEEHPKIYDFVDFSTPWASGACLLIPKKIYDVIGHFDEGFFMYCEDVDFSWRARAEGFAVKTCPRALFFHAVTDRPFSSDTQALMLKSGIRLARKWGGQSFENALLEQSRMHGISVTDVPAIQPCGEAKAAVSDFDHLFYFAPSRW